MIQLGLIKLAAVDLEPLVQVGLLAQAERVDLLVRAV
jgi:hypothetical protein